MGAEGGVDRSGLEVTACVRPPCRRQDSPRSSHQPSPGRPSLRDPGAVGEEVPPHTPSPNSRPLSGQFCLVERRSGLPVTSHVPFTACPLTPVWPLYSGLHLAGALSTGLPLGFCRTAWDAGQTGAQPEAVVDGALGPSVPPAHPAAQHPVLVGCSHSPTRCRGPGPLGVRGSCHREVTVTLRLSSYTGARTVRVRMGRVYEAGWEVVRVICTGESDTSPWGLGWRPETKPQSEK